VTVGKTSLKAALQRGLTVTLSGLKPGRKKITATRGGRTLAKTTVTVPAAGRATARLRFGSAARRTLRGRKSVALVVHVAGLSKTITLKG
jgi:hypothetical protein